MIFVDTNILLRSVYPPDPHYGVTSNALASLTARAEILCIAPQNLIEFWTVATRPQKENGLGMNTATAEQEIVTMRDLFQLLPYTDKVVETWQRIVVAQGISGKQTHDAHLVAMMQVHSIFSVLTFNASHFVRFPGIKVLDPAQV